MSLRLRLVNAWLRRVEKPALARLSVAEARRRFARQAWLFRTPRGARYRAATLGGLPVTWCDGVDDAPVILWLHGGAHVMGGPGTHRAMVARLAQMAGCRACLPDFRLAPEHPYPAALNDAEAVFNALVRTGLRAEQIVLGGDSSGGGLMLALLARLLERGERPACAVAMSPWTDLTGSSPSLRENAEREVLLPPGRYDEARGYYIAGRDAATPGISPLFADFPECPPVWLQTGQTEILRDDTLRMAEKLKDLGADVTLDLWPDLPHVAAILQGWLPEADAVLTRAAGFIRATCRSAS